MDKVVPSPPKIATWEGLYLLPRKIVQHLLLKMMTFGMFWVALLICISILHVHLTIPICNKLAIFAAQNTFQHFQGRATAPFCSCLRAPMFLVVISSEIGGRSGAL